VMHLSSAPLKLKVLALTTNKVFIATLIVVMLSVTYADCRGAGLKKVYKIGGRRKWTKDSTPRVNFAPAPSSTDPGRFTFIFDLFKSGNGLVVPLEEIIDIEFKLESEFYRHNRMAC
jgi:hypothetical protein